MFKIALLLTLLQIIHGDLKLDNFLFRQTHDTPEYDIVVTDLGFAGDAEMKAKYHPLMGWSGYEPPACLRGDMISNELLMPGTDFNLWQLSQSLQRDKIAVLFDTQPLHLFAGLQFPEEFDKHMMKYCPLYKPPSREDAEPVEVYLV